MKRPMHLKRIGLKNTRTLHRGCTITYYGITCVVSRYEKLKKFYFLGY